MAAEQSLIDQASVLSDLAVWIITGIISIMAWRINKFLKDYGDTLDRIESQQDKLEKHDMILFGEEEIQGHSGLQVVAYTNREYLRQHHRVLDRENLLDDNQPPAPANEA